MERGNGGDKLGGLHRAEIQKLRDQLNRQYANLDKAGGNAARSSRTVTQLEKRIAELELRDRSASKDLAATGPPGGRLSMTSLQGALGAENALIEYVESDGSISAFVVTEKRIELFGDIAHREDIRAGLEQLRFQFESLKFGKEKLAGLLPLLKKKADTVLAALYSRLIQPTAGAIEGKSLIIVPAGVLHYVPFQALHTGDSYLIESHTINYAASAAAWLQLRSRKKPGPVRKALLVGYADASIPQVEAEIRGLEDIFGESLTLTGEDAQFRACLDAAGGHDLIHFACHGTFRPDNPTYSSLHLADGWVTVGDICETRLNAELVTLSACETGLREIAAGEEILGLARGFLTAGANNVVLSLWTVNDAATAALMSNFYEEMQRGTSIAASLRSAQIRSIVSGDHPYFWAPFFLIGK
jgi:CHAT domain-containing protein